MNARQGRIKYTLGTEIKVIIGLISEIDGNRYKVVEHGGREHLIPRHKAIVTFERAQ